ncbi:MAG TPA: MBL fold metallo-hydrolase [Candidatus Limnocylindrales bacterium]|nr:MBL fold metallo-hydrolase [Candidatus Limnocylindrales bacterium]
MSAQGAELPFELLVLGAGPAYTDRVGATGAAYLVRHGEDGLVLDLGQGSFPALAGAIEPSALLAVFVSHLHPDHFIDLVALRHYLRWEFQPPRRVRVIGPAGIGDRMDALHAEPGWTAAALDVEPLAVGERQVGPFSVEAARVTHTDDSYGFRVTLADANGPGLVYSGDCGRASDLQPLIRPGDWLLTECSFGAGPAEPGAEHLDGPAVGALAAATRPGRILLTHIQMGHEGAAAVAAVRALYDGQVDLVEPGWPPS